MQEFISIAKSVSGMAGLPAALIVVFFLTRKGYITINRSGNGSKPSSGPSIEAHGICTVPGCHDKVIATETKVEEHERWLQDLKDGQKETCEEIRALPDEIVRRLRP